MNPVTSTSSSTPSDSSESSARRPARLDLHAGTYLSSALGREQPYSFFTPPDWNPELPDDGTRYPLLILLHGRDSDHTHWATHTRIARYLTAYRLFVAFPDGGNGWYTNAFDGSEQREDDLLQDFLPHLQAQWPLLPPGRAWAIGGLSMGGYGAVKLALKHTEWFSVGFSHSGAFDRPRAREFHPVFGDPERDRAHRQANNVYALAERALMRFPWERPRLHLDCGLSDPLLDASRNFSDHLNFLGYLHDYRELPGHHTWPYWNRAFKTLLPLIAHEIGADQNT